MDDLRPRAFLDRLSRALGGISFQLAVVVSLAVLPIGIIAIWESLELARESRRSAETMLLGLTADSVDLEHRLIEAGLGIDTSFAANAIQAGEDQAQCIKTLAGFAADHPAFRSVSLVPLDGISRCASDGQTRDLRADETHLRFIAHPVPTVDHVADSDEATAPSLRVLQPLRENGALQGYLSLVLQSFPFPSAPNPNGIPAPQDVVLFNTAGTVLTSTRDFQDLAARLPPEAELDLLLHGPDGFVESANRSGTSAGFAKVTLIPDAIVAVGIWPSDNQVSQIDHAWPKAVSFPLLMWFVGMAIAMFAARRLVIRPIKMLRDEMRRFALGQRNDPIVLAPGAALEIRETVNTFNKLELIVTRNEAALALTAEGKLLLLREVHHRIKNNLQMISSIISIHRRKAIDPEVGKVLRSLQDRVMSIAAVDQSLYTNGDVVDVRADLLISSITERLVGVNLEPGHGVQISTRFETVMLHADQIGPLSLLANEAITNALKYVGKPDAGPASIDIALTWDADSIHFSVSNSLGSGLRGGGETPESTKLGMVLIRAFADQLAADVQSGPVTADHKFHLSVRFRPNGLAIVGNPVRDAAGAA
jgi:two-component sensor histidine kinase